MNTKYRYVWLDFETTWLDVTKDEAIQIGIVELQIGEKEKIGEKGGNFHIISEYKSLIKPVWKQEDFKTIVWFITWLKVEDLENAPSFDDIKPAIEQYFDENTILIGHNIQFDINFLQKYMPDVKYHSAIDTFALAQTFVHYAPSYSLEVLIEYVRSKDDDFAKIISKFSTGSGQDTFHDALYDTKNSLALFVYFHSYIEKLSKKYPALPYFLWFHQLRKEFFPKTLQVPHDIVFPALNKIAASNVTLGVQEDSIDIESLENLKKLYVWNIPLKKLITRLAPNKNIVLTFANKQKLDIVKNILNDLWIKNIWFAKEEQTINSAIFKSFLNKKTFTEKEVNFILKYLSHVEKWYGVLDLNNSADYQVYYFLKDTRAVVRYPIVLSTHHWFFSMVNDNKAYDDYAVCFFDSESRYKSFNFFISMPRDPYYTLNFIEMLIYAYETRNAIKEWKYDSTLVFLHDFYNFFQVFIGNLFIETKNLFVKVQDDKVACDPMINHSNFYKTNLLYQNFEKLKADFETHLLLEDAEWLHHHVDQIEKIFNSLVTIQKKMYDSDNFYFVYSESTSFTSRWEFTDKIDKRQTVFLSNTTEQFDHLDKESTFEPSIEYHKIPHSNKVVDFVIETLATAETPKTIFIVSTQKYQSQNMFESMITKWLKDKALLLVENITWWAGKNIFNAKQKWHKIIIWWYQFLLNALSSQIDIDICVYFNISWNNEQGIVDDIRRYGG